MLLPLPMGYVHVLCNLRLHFCRRTGTTLRLPCCTCFCNSSVEHACMAFLAARLWRSMLLPKPRSTGCRCKRIPKAAATVEEVGQVATVDLKEEERLVAQLVPLLVAAKLQWLILRPSSSGHVAKASQAARALLSSFVSERSGAAGMVFVDIQLQKDKQQYMGAERQRKQ